MGTLFLKRTCILSFIPAIVLTVCSEQAFAYKIGDFNISPIVTASERYDSNITSSKTNELDDFITEVSLGALISREGKNQIFSLEGTIAHEVFASEDQFNNTSENMLARYRLDIDQSQSINVRESFLHSESPTTFADQFGGTSGRYSYYLNRFGFDYTKEVSKELSMTGGYQNEIYERDLVGSADSSLHGFDFRTDYTLDPETIVSGIYGLQLRQFDPGSDVSVNTLDASVRRYFTKQLYADLSGGASVINVQDGKDYTEPRVKFVLTDEISEKTVSSLTILKSYEVSNDSPEVFDQWRTSLDLNHNLYKRLRGHGEVFYGEGKYVDLGVKDEFMGINLRLDYELTPSSQAFISDTYSDKSSNQSLREYSRNVIMAGVNYRF